MRRSSAGLSEVVARDNLEWAFYCAARGARHRREVSRFAARLDAELAGLRHELLDQTFDFSRFTRFDIRDPKPRTIHAPCFRARVVHHALMAVMGPVLERALVADTFACRAGKGPHAAVVRAQHHLRRHPWFVQIDIAEFFGSVDHHRLLDDLRGRFKSPALLRTCERLIGAYHTRPGKGLPIGALSSQHFANHHLGRLDRFILEELGARGMVRYMDDVVFWCDSRACAGQMLGAVREMVARDRHLHVKPGWRIQRNREGLRFCGVRVRPGALRLGLRRKRRYSQGRRAWERAFADGLVDAKQLQQGYTAVLATTAPVDALGFRRAELSRRPPKVEA